MMTPFYRNLKTILKFIIPIFFIYAFESQAKALSCNYGMGDLDKACKMLKKRQHFQDVKKRIVKLGDTIYYLTSDGNIAEMPFHILADELRDFGKPYLMAPPSDRSNNGGNDNQGQGSGQSNDDSGRRTDNPGGNKRHGRVDFGDATINKIYEQLIRNPSKIITDSNSNKAFWLGKDKKGRPAVLEAPLNQLDKVVGVPKMPKIEFDRKGNLIVPPLDNGKSTPSTPKPNPKNMVCTNKDGIRFTPRNHMISSSAQLDLGGGGNCNSFRVAGNLIMTNAHCIGRTERVRGCTQHLMYDGYGSMPTSRFNRCADRVFRKRYLNKRLRGFNARFLINGRMKSVRCNAVKSIAVSLDYAILKCPGIPKEVPISRVATKRPREGSPLTLATWDFRGGGARKRIQKGRRVDDSVRGGYGGNHLAASTRVIAGNSGSVMYNNNMEAVALINTTQQGTDGREQTGFYAVADVMKHLKKVNPKDAKIILDASKKVQVNCKENGATTSQPPARREDRDYYEQGGGYESGYETESYY